MLECVDGLMCPDVMGGVGMLMAAWRCIGEEGTVAVREVVSVKGVVYGAEEEGKKSRRDFCSLNAGCSLINNLEIIRSQYAADGK